jgi:hypothetical protein
MAPEVLYFVNVLDENGEVMASAGSESEPLRVIVRTELEGDSPSLPDGDPEPSCAEDSRSRDQEERRLGGTRGRLMFIEAGLGTGAGIPISDGIERRSCGEDLHDDIQVDSSLAWTELVVSPALGFYITRRLTLGVRGRLQFAGGVYPETPHMGVVFAEVRFFPLPNDPVRLFTSFGLGYGFVVHPITLEGAVNCGEFYYRESGGFLGEVGVGLLFDITAAFAISIQLNIFVLAPDPSIQGDLTFGLHFSIPRR